MRHGEYSNPAAPCTCLTSEGRRCAPMVLSLASTTEASACETSSETAFRRSCARRVSRIRRRSPLEARSPGASPTTARARPARGPRLVTRRHNPCVRLHQRSVERFLDCFRSPRAAHHAAPAATPTSTSARKEGYDEQAPQHQHCTECPHSRGPNEGICAHEGQGRLLQGGHRHPPGNLQ